MLLKNAGYAPEEVHLVNDIGKLYDRLAGNDNTEEKLVIIKKLRENELKYHMMMEQRNRNKQNTTL
ncbi:hypothetical protein JOC69_003438 [Heliobacterium gestii]|nr:hypothetical protein [Heliomicrobium gestii]